MPFRDLHFRHHNLLHDPYLLRQVHSDAGFGTSAQRWHTTDLAKALQCSQTNFVEVVLPSAPVARRK